jgi:hypothetical protein
MDKYLAILIFLISLSVFVVLYISISSRISEANTLKEGDGFNIHNNLKSNNDSDRYDNVEEELSHLKSDSSSSDLNPNNFTFID